MGWKAAGARRCLQDFTGARSYYVSLHTAQPTSSNELSGSGYARLELPSSGWTVASASVVENGERRLKATNTAARSFPTPSGDWSDPTHAAFVAASTGWTPYLDGALSENVDAPKSGATVRFNAEDFSIYIVTDD